MRHYLGSKSLTKFDEALERLLNVTQPIVRTELVPLTEAIGRVLAKTVIAPFDVPPFRRAAMDGYAVRADDIAKASSENPVSLKVIGSVYAGDPIPSWVVTEETCAQIATGAPVPEGANCVVPFEDTEREGEIVRILKTFPPHANITEKGADVREGETVLREGTYLTSAKIGILAALGFNCIAVYTKPKVAIVPTGSEIAKPGSPIRLGQVYDINTYTITSLAAHHGCEPIPMEIVPDEAEALQEALSKALSIADCVVFSAGSAIGERDLLPKLLSERGEVLFHGLAARPGRPTLAAVVDGKLVINLPGFPTSCLMMAMVLLVPALRKMARLPKWQPQRVAAKLGHDVYSPEGLKQFLTVRLKNWGAVGGKGNEEIIAESAYKESGTITSLSNAEGFIVISEEVTYLPMGTTVTVTLL